MEPAADGAPPTTPIGRAGRLEAAALEAGGDHAILVRETGHDGRARVLLTTDKRPSGERLVVMPLDDDVDVRVDGDALAVWLGSGILGEVPRQERAMTPAERVPPWATVVGAALLLTVVIFAVIGSAVVFTLLARIF